MTGPKVNIQYTRTGTDTDGDPIIERGTYADYDVRIVLSRGNGLWSTVVDEGSGKSGFNSIEEAKAYAEEVVTKKLALRLAQARRTIELFGPEFDRTPPTSPPYRLAGYQRKLFNVGTETRAPVTEVASDWHPCDETKLAYHLRTGGQVEGFPELRSEVRPIFTRADAPCVESAAQYPLTVWYGSMPESNGRQNWTACLRRTHPTDKWSQEFCFARSEYPDRVRYEADRMRWLIGETAERPDILAYDAAAHSGYVERDYHLEKLLEALAPLANMAAVVGSGKDDSVYVGQSGHRLTFGDFRRAEAAYAPYRKATPDSNNSVPTDE